MESVGRKSRPRRSFTPEFKAEIVELCQRGDRSVGQVARDFDLTETRCVSGSSRLNGTSGPGMTAV
jgi:transposase-like protein